jgi:hypothetical protein
MALDYKTLRAMATGQPRFADDYCPECGRPWRDPALGRPALAASLPWRACALLAIAAYLGLAFGSPAWGDYQAVVNAREMLRGTEGLGEGLIDPHRYVIRHVK